MIIINNNHKQRKEDKNMSLNEAFSWGGGEGAGEYGINCLPGQKGKKKNKNTANQPQHNENRKQNDKNKDSTFRR